MIDRKTYEFIFKKYDLNSRIKALGEHKNIVIYGDKALLKAVKNNNVKAFVHVLRVPRVFKINGVDVVNFLELERYNPDIILGRQEDLKRISEAVTRHFDRENIERVQVLPIFENCNFNEEFYSVYAEKTNLALRLKNIRCKYSAENIAAYPDSEEFNFLKNKYALNFKVYRDIKELKQHKPELIVLTKLNSINTAECLYKNGINSKVFLLFNKNIIEIIKECWLDNF